MSKHKVYDPSACATNPGQTRISRHGFARYFARNGLHRRFLYLLTFLPFQWHRLPGFRAIFQWHRMKEQFLYGDVNPAIVLDAKLGLVASLTNIDASGGYHPHPVIKIFEEKLHLIHPHVMTNDPLATVAFYGRGEDTARTGLWANFYPIVVNCVLGSPRRAEQMRNQIPAAQWEALRFGLRLMRGERKPGLYSIDLPDEILRTL